MDSIPALIHPRFKAVLGSTDWHWYCVGWIIFRKWEDIRWTSSCPWWGNFSGRRKLLKFLPNWGILFWSYLGTLRGKGNRVLLFFHWVSVGRGFPKKPRQPRLRSLPLKLHKIKNLIPLLSLSLTSPSQSMLCEISIHHHTPILLTFQKAFTPRDNYGHQEKYSAAAGVVLWEEGSFPWEEALWTTLLGTFNWAIDTLYM